MQLGARVRRRRQQRRGRRAGRGVPSRRRRHRSVVERSVLVQRRGGNVGQHLTVPSVEDAQAPARATTGGAGGHAADHAGPHVPTPADGEHLVEIARLDDRQHALLRLAGHDLERLHARFAPGDGRDVDVHADTSPRRGLARGTGQPGPAEVLDAHHQPGVEQREAGLDQPLLLVRIADLDTRSLGRIGRLVREAGRREHAHATDAVAPGARPEQHGQVADATRLTEHQTIGRQRPQAEHVHERIVREGLVEHRLTTDGGHAHGVAVSRHSADDSFGDPTAPGVVERTESQRIHQGDRTGPHGEDVAQDPTHPGGRTLIRLDGRRVVVALDADGRRDAVPDVDHTGVLTGSDEHPFGLGGQPAEMDPRRFVRAVLGPHHRIHGQLEWIGLASEDPCDVAGLVVGQPERPVERFCHVRTLPRGRIRSGRRYVCGGHWSCIGHTTCLASCK